MTSALHFLALVAILLLPAVATAQNDPRPEDAARLSRYDAAAGDALLQALANGAPKDITALTTALAGEPLPALDETLQGDWTCRTMKLGGLADLVVYSPFKCSFTINDTGFAFEKLTGSQRTRGAIILLDGRAIYLGVGYVAGQNPPAYADLPQEFTSDGSVQSDIAILERVSPTRARLLFPSPAVESDFDILELTR
ncbi:protein of unknown function [Sulfitobacter brevis]|uniref:DUF4893 domain-containing protein n=1 Tax=Sulfitobacter brevis TaxID=74348 RepID=A0A1I1WV61_9RHOB|nr:DUF4893 domain-containing protein [Sulfitobacter brevis]SFD99006.1 protein of unknown function [Sulfitobacter brevis]